MHLTLGELTENASLLNIKYIIYLQDIENMFSVVIEGKSCYVAIDGGGGGEREKRETKEAKQQSNVHVNLSWASPIPSVKPLQ